MKILIASTPATGHLNPLLAIGRILIAEGHEVVGLSGNALRERIEGIGAEFRPLPAGADFDLGDIVSVVPELKHINSWAGMVARRDRAPVRRHHSRSAQGPTADSAGFPGRRHHRRRHDFRRAADAARSALETAPHCSLRHIDFALAP